MGLQIGTKGLQIAAAFGITNWTKVELQIGAAFEVTNWRKKITNRGKTITNRGRNYKSVQNSSKSLNKFQTFEGSQYFSPDLR